MATQIFLNGTDWAARITDLGVQPSERKQVRSNVKGGAISIPVRSQVGCYQVQFTFPYSTVGQMQALRTMFDAQVPVAITHTLDFPQGNYTPIDYAKTRIKNLDAVLYAVVMTFALDSPPVAPIPGPKTDLAAGGITAVMGL